MRSTSTIESPTCFRNRRQHRCHRQHRQVATAKVRNLQRDSTPETQPLVHKPQRETMYIMQTKHIANYCYKDKRILL